MRCALLLLPLFLVGCSDKPPAEEQQASAEADKRFLAIAANYTKTSTMVTPAMNWAPTLCSPPHPQPRPAFSDSDDLGTHGGKIYFLFASDINAYIQAATVDSPLGQTVVKESWAAKPVEKPDGDFYAMHASGQQVARYARKDLIQYERGAQKELFIMTKIGGTEEKTDKGWVYGVVSADAKRVLASGRLKNCMACHEDAGVDRLFGLVGN